MVIGKGGAKICRDKGPREGEGLATIGGTIQNSCDSRICMREQIKEGHRPNSE